MATTSKIVPVDGRKARGSRTRARLLRVALTLFGARGFHAVSMKELANTAGIKPASIYNHFTSKELILEAALVDGLRRFQEFVEGPDNTSEDSATRLEGVVRRHVAWQLTRENPVREADSLLESVTSGDLLSGSSRSEIDQLLRCYRHFVMNLVAQVRDDPAPRSPSVAVITAALLVLCDRAHLGQTDFTETRAQVIQDECWYLIVGMLGLKVLPERHSVWKGISHSSRPTDTSVALRRDAPAERNTT